MDKPVYSAADRAQLIEECKTSGLSISAFAAKRGIPKGTIYQWMSSARRANKPLPIARVVPVSQHPDNRPKSRELPTVMLELGAIRIHVAPGFDAPTLAAVIDVVRGGHR